MVLRTHLIKFYLIYMAISLFTRFILCNLEAATSFVTFAEYTAILINGTIYDTVVFICTSPLILLSLYVGSKLRKLRHFYFSFLTLAFIVLCIFIAQAEILFWKEFSSRFNFIAIDYLVYTQEVLGNIKESFNIPIILLFNATLSAFLFFIAQKFESKQDLQKVSLFQIDIIVIYFLCSIIYCIPWIPKIPISDTTKMQIGKNGIYELYYAYTHNSLDYTSLYKTKQNSEVIPTLEKEFKEKTSVIQTNKNLQIVRHIKSPITQRKNIIYIVVESLGADFMSFTGNKKEITPHLDELTKSSLFFTNIYATGTRTVRGIEAITLSLPPTPGASIVRRKNNENLFNIASVLKNFGYDSKFIYGGYGVFDNMNYFFSHNDFKIVDRSNFTDTEIQFSNIWGVCDEDLFHKTLLEADTSFKNKTPFFSFVLTTSNHRPFTYPDGKIDIPSHTGRDGAVKYTDYAIHEFLNEARKKPWFQNTIFVILGDHSAGGRGVIDIAVPTYHIPLIIYDPSQLENREVPTVASQIDVSPTVLSLLGFNYNSQFFGKDILKMTKNEERFFAGTYQKVGFYKNGYFVQLGPKKELKIYNYDVNAKAIRQEVSAADSKTASIQSLAISYYQHASYLYQHHLLGSIKSILQASWNWFQNKSKDPSS